MLNFVFFGEGGVSRSIIIDGFCDIWCKFSNQTHYFTKNVAEDMWPKFCLKMRGSKNAPLSTISNAQKIFLVERKKLIKTTALFNGTLCKRRIWTGFLTASYRKKAVAFL